MSQNNEQIKKKQNVFCSKKCLNNHVIIDIYTLKES